ncbi:MAG: hypothetical protein ACI9CD_000351 [Candidatus Deianiraeaceae bacterium]|jgi:hypothetical protein
MKITINNKDLVFTDYFEMVDYLARNKIDYEFPNSVILHSTQLVQKFLEFNDGLFCIKALNFRPEIFDIDDTISAIKKFLSRGKNKMHIIVESDEKINKKRTFIEKFSQEIDDGTIIFKQTNNSTGKRFMVISNSFREATSTSNGNNFCAWVNFNDSKISNNLRKEFVQEFDQADDITL